MYVTRMLQHTRALHTQTEPLSAMSNGSTNAQIEPGYQHTAFPSSCLSAVHDREAGCASDIL